MSLSTQVKEEICRFHGADCCKKAFLSAVIHANAVLNFDARGLRVQINCEHGLKVVESVFSSLFRCDYHCEGGKFSFYPPESVQILLELGIFELKEGQTVLNEGAPWHLIERECCLKSYLKGAFLVSGSISVPAVGYGMEISCNSQRLVADLKGIMNEFGIKAFNGRKNGKFRVYVRDKEGVCDFLAAVEATKSVLKVHSLAAERDLRRELSRKANCDVYNADKALRTSMEQIKAINGVKLTDEKLIEVANARLNNPEATYEELKNILNVSKSTIKYRLNKIVKLFNAKVKGDKL